MAAIKIYRGDTWQRAWIIKDGAGNPVDLTGAAARLHVRDADGVKVMEASTADGRLTLQSAAGRIDLVMPASATAVAPASYRFDIEVTYPSGVRITYEQATLLVMEDMSRD
ncbi:phage baseplate upper protein [Calidifontimicrobium sp. SYSU G02091]|uniref:phage baseplate upper protein n=1 Tax=Calidifontimicrobium sp. SYSU G02091 TaxID=2926421 RepID=UPI001F52E15D|nr:phage baseplate upper protein [Calidifontimicrobium sp. SYSU G02091]MCI1193407.1 phage baseplate upper protein [Calidifontimicrobium sp. SYSU G02091]